MSANIRMRAAYEQGREARVRSVSSEVVDIWAKCRTLGVSDAQLAGRSGVDRVTLHHIFNGNTANPKAETLAFMRDGLTDIMAELWG